MADNDKKWLLTPKLQLHVTGQLIPKDIHYRIKFKDRPKYRFTLCMPDGMICSVPVFEGEDPDKKMKAFIENWYKVTKREPELFDHFKIEDKCPVCGGDMMCHILERGDMVWCLNYPICHYVEAEDGLKTRERISKKYGLKFKITSQEVIDLVNKDIEETQQRINELKTSKTTLENYQCSVSNVSGYQSITADEILKNEYLFDSLCSLFISEIIIGKDDVEFVLNDLKQ